MPLQLTDKITHGYSVGDMLNSIEGIIDLLKHVIFFGVHGSFINLSVNF
jgi:hypothetical protein